MKVQPSCCQQDLGVLGAELRDARDSTVPWDDISPASPLGPPQFSPSDWEMCCCSKTNQGDIRRAGKNPCRALR